MTRSSTILAGLGGLLLVGAVSASLLSGPFAREESPAPAAAPEAVLVDAQPVAAQPEEPADEAGGRPALRPEKDGKVQQAIDRGLARLAALQDRSTGGWVQDVGFKFNDKYEVQVSGQPHVGVTSLALMAFLSGGHLPGRGRYGDVVQRGVDFVLAAVDDDTGFVSNNETRMYSHAFATLLLAEIFGMTHRADLKDKLQQAVDLTVKSQNKQGSWRYRPFAPDSDMSICVCQLMALRAARNIGIQVPRSTIDAAYEYIRASAYSRESRSRFGAFKYQIDQPSTRVSFALTSAGLASLYHAGFYDDPMVKPGLQWLKARCRGFGLDQRHRTYFYWYGHYYAAQVFFIAADKNPEIWDDFYWPLIRDELLETQRGDGSWDNHPGPGDAFSTAIASIILQIPYQYLPIFQR